MEKPPAFNLNESLSRWRACVSSSPAFQNENVDELESHLCDLISRLQSSGLSEEEAWLIAQKRIGSIDSLAQEFEKLTESESISAAQPKQCFVPWVRSVIAIGAGIGLAALLAFAGEAMCLDYMRDNFQNFTALWLFIDLLSLLAAGYVTALLAPRFPVRHALVAGGGCWALITYSAAFLVRKKE